MEAVSPGAELWNQPRRLFLALAMVKSKPAELRLADYIDRFRESVFLEVEALEHGARSYIEEVAYWKDISSKSRVLITTLKQQLEALECEHPEATMKSVVDNETPNDANPGEEPIHLEVTSMTTSRQPVIGVQTLPSTNVLQDQRQLQEVLNQLEVDVSGPDVNAYLKHLYILHQTLGRTAPHRAVLGQSIIQLCLDFRQLISRTVQERPEANVQTDSCPYRSDGTHMEQAERGKIARIQLAQRTFGHIIKACTHLANEKFDHHIWDQTVFQINQMLQALLEAITTLAGRDYSKGKDTFTSTLCAEISSLVVLMVSSLASIGEGAKEAVTGFLQVLFSRVGFLLRCCVQEGTLDANNAHQPSREILPIEARSMVWILERVLAQLRQSHTWQHRNETQSLLEESNITETLWDSLPLPKLFESLQDTTLQAVFTNDMVSFAHQLLPVQPPEGEPLSLHKDLFDECELWFESEIWRLLCWDKFRKEAGL